MTDDSTRKVIIQRFVNASIDEMLELSNYLKDTQFDHNGAEPTWPEIRDAILAKLFDVESTIASESIHSEYVRENCTEVIQ